MWQLTGSWLGLPGRRLDAVLDHLDADHAVLAFTDLLAGFLDQLNHSHWRRLS